MTNRTEKKIRTPAFLPLWLDGTANFCAQIIEPGDVPASLKPWVYLQASMTQALTDSYGQTPDVKVHKSANDTLLPWEKTLLATNDPQTSGFTRHISLNINNTAVLAARSTTPTSSTLVPLLAELQTTPLAKLLFEDPQWQRLGQPLPLQDADGSFGRACTWQMLRTGERLVVEEFFLFDH